MKKTLCTLALFALAALVATPAAAQMLRSGGFGAGRRGGGNLLPPRSGMGGNRPGMGMNARTMLGGGAGGAAVPGAAGAAGMAGAEEQKSTEEFLADLPRGTNGVPRLAFDQAPIELLLYAYADEAKKVLIPAPNLPKTQVTLKTQDEFDLTREQYLNAIERVLTLNGVVLQEVDDIYLYALDRKTVRTAGIRTEMNIPAEGNPEKGKVISQLIRFSYITAEEAQKAIEGFKDPAGLFQVFERNNSILVTDTQENVNRMLEIIKELDQPNPVLEEVFTCQIEYALAADIKTALETIVTESQKELEQGKSGPKTSGAPGFGSSRPSTPQPTRLLNLNNRPGQPNAQQPQPSTPNAPMLAQISDADRGMIRGKVLILADERSNKLIVITSKTNMDFFNKIIKTLDVETTPEVSVEVIRLKYAEAEEVASMLNDLIGNNGGSSQNRNNQNANARGAAGTANRNLTQTRPGTPPAARPPTANPTFSNANTLGELNKDNIKILADKRINGIVIMARKADMKAVKEVIEDMDVKLSQVLLETVIVQIELGDDLQTGIDWVQRGKYRAAEQVQAKDPITGQPLFYALDTNGRVMGTGIEGSTVSVNNQDYAVGTVPVMNTVFKTVRDNFFNHGGANSGYMAGGGGGSGSSLLQSLFGSSSASSGSSSGTTDESGTASTVANAAAIAANPIGGGLNYFLKSDKLNLGAVIQAAKSDSRSKVLASPILMTVDNKEATIEATDMIYLFSGYQYSGSSYNGTQVRNYEKRDIGLTVKVTPRINPNGTVVLTIEETFETKGADQAVPNESGGTDNYATVTTRKMSSDVSVENRQTIVMGGLQRSVRSKSTSGIPILKDIPWIGKWLFGSTSDSEQKSELLVFITPYVLDDAESAQAEALRRKQTLSDPRPWEDNGWSLSPVADPISKKEQLRRFVDEWERQDEERKTKYAIEKAKVDRVKKLKEMSKNERERWIKLHEDEVKEIEEDSEKTEKDQAKLRAFVEDLKKKTPEEYKDQKLKEAEKAIEESKEVEKNEYRKMVEEKAKDGTPLPAGETLKKDIEAAKAAKPAEAPTSAKPAPAPAKPAAAPAPAVAPSPAKPAAAPAPAVAPAPAKPAPAPAKPVVAPAPAKPAAAPAKPAAAPAVAASPAKSAAAPAPAVAPAPAKPAAAPVKPAAAPAPAKPAPTPAPAKPAAAPAPVSPAPAAANKNTK